MDVRASWTKFRSTPYFRGVYLLLVAGIASFVRILDFSTGIVCFSVVLIPVLTLLVPHWFGERRVKHHALNGLVIFVLVPILFAAIVTPSFMGQDQFVLSQEETRGSLSDGRVTPYRIAEPGTTEFNFTLVLTSTDARATDFSIHVIVLSFENFAVTEENATMASAGDGTFGDGEPFFANVRLEPLAHSFGFQVLDGDEVVVEACCVPGPFNANYGTYFTLWWYSGIFSMAFIMAGFFLILLVYWWTRKARAVRGARGPRKRDEGGGEYTCTNCGADVSETDMKCPNCGAAFGSEGAGEPAKAK